MAGSVVADMPNWQITLTGRQQAYDRMSYNKYNKNRYLHLEKSFKANRALVSGVRPPWVMLQPRSRLPKVVAVFGLLVIRQIDLIVDLVSQGLRRKRLVGLLIALAQDETRID